jgi:membrane protease subunit (stomatin/prohibitin family)
MFYKRRTAKKIISSGGMGERLICTFGGAEQGLVGGMQLQVAAGEQAWFAAADAIDFAPEGSYVLPPELIPQVNAALELPEPWEKRQLIMASCGFVDVQRYESAWRNDTQFLGRDPLDGLLRFTASGSYTYHIRDKALYRLSVLEGRLADVRSGVEALLAARIADDFAAIITDRPLHLRRLDAQCTEMAEELRKLLLGYVTPLGLDVPQLSLQLHLAESSQPMLEKNYPQQACFNAHVKEVFTAKQPVEE